MEDDGTMEQIEDIYDFKFRSFVIIKTEQMERHDLVSSGM